MDLPEIERSYAIVGMTCEHCRTSVRKQVWAVAGVRAVAIDLAAGAMTVRGEDVADDAVVAAVVEAGYAVGR